jgi:hypothetical protein
MGGIRCYFGASATALVKVSERVWIWPITSFAAGQQYGGDLMPMIRRF